MNEEQLYELMQSLDNDLMTKEVDQLTKDMDIDIKSISKKAHKKLRMENTKMKKRYPIIAASLIAVLSVSVVYASDISNFAKLFSNKKEVYSAVVEGDVFYLKEPVALDDGMSLKNLLFSKDNLSLIIKAGAAFEGNTGSVSINANGIEYVATGYMINPNNDYHISFYNKKENSYANYLTTDKITLNIQDKSYDIQLINGDSVVASGEILQAEQKYSDSGKDVVELDWINMGYKEMENGVQILANFADEELKLISIGNPVQRLVTSVVNNISNTSSSTSPLAHPLIGYDSDGKAYKYEVDIDGLGYPITVFKSYIQNDREIELSVPSIIVGYDLQKEFPSYAIEIPELNQEISMNIEIDLKLQSMILNNIKRTSSTTAELTLQLNTGVSNGAAIRDAYVDGSDIKTLNSVWNGDACTITISFDEDLTSTDMKFYSPCFVVDGNWSLALNSQK